MIHKPTSFMFAITSLINNSWICIRKIRTVQVASKRSVLLRQLLLEQ